MMLAAVNFQSPLFWAVFIGWILCVVLHEFAHGLIAMFGGDYTIRERGGLSLNPLQYVDPVGSLLLPAVWLVLGGLPLPGGATFVRRDLIRSNSWLTAMSLAGPAMNVLIFLALAIAIHPAVGWVKRGTPVELWTPAQLVVASLAMLNILAAFFNLIPIPPLDGFNAFSAYLPPQTQVKLLTPPGSYISTIFFLVILMSPQVSQWLFRASAHSLKTLGFDERTIGQVFLSIYHTMFTR